MKSNDDSFTLMSEVTTDTRLEVLESNMGTIKGSMGKVLSMLEDIQATNLESSKAYELAVHRDGRPGVS